MFTVLMFIDDLGREHYFLVLLDDSEESEFLPSTANNEDDNVIDLTDYTRN